MVTSARLMLPKHKVIMLQYIVSKIELDILIWH